MIFLEARLQDDGQKVVYLSPLAVALAAALMLVNAAISVKLSLGLHTQIAVAAVR
jgi:hypothetical protein